MGKISYVPRAILLDIIDPHLSGQSKKAGTQHSITSPLRW